jgi:hypothetical protein
LSSAAATPTQKASGTIDRQALELHDLSLPIERTVPSEIVNRDAAEKAPSRLWTTSLIAFDDAGSAVVERAL